jgi:Iron-sulfur cluster-binding domain
MLDLLTLSDRTDHAITAFAKASAEFPPFDNGTQLLDRDTIAKIREVGVHPFILVCVQGDSNQSPHWLICETENDLPKFVDELAGLPMLGECKLLRGFERALRLETYEAAECWFSWVKEAPLGRAEIVRLGLPLSASLGSYYGYPTFDVSSAAASDNEDRRLRTLSTLFEAYLGADGNNATRIRLVEALAFALSRAFGARGEYHEARWIVDRAVQLWPSSIHLKAAQHALGLKLDGKMVPDRLVKFIGEDNLYLKQFVCPLPFEHFEISPSGEVLVCCGHWLPTSIGNFMKGPIDGILNSAKAQKIRESMTDGSYKYCNHLDCGAMIQGTLPTAKELDNPATRQAVADADYRMKGVDFLTFGFDQTCNLSCPSCRTHRIVEKTSASIEKALAVEEKLVDLLPTVKVLHINPAGELFGSKPSRKLLEMIDNERCPQLILDIISNGTLFTEEEWNKFPGIHGKVRSVRISIDAASKPTFEKLRRLGRYEPFVENMRFLSRLRAAGTIPQLKFSFTYQLENFREMPEFVEFCASMNADFAIFERLQNIAFTAKDYRAKAVHHPEHPQHGEFLRIISKPIFATPRVWHDFDYQGAAKMTSDQARERLAKTQAVMPNAVAVGEVWGS